VCLKLDTHGYSPRVLHRILYAAGQCKSFALAGTMLATLGDIAISTPHLAELTAEIGQELTAARDRQVAELPPATTRDQRPGEVPAAVAVEVDGGRIRTRAEGHGPGVHDPHWNEDKAACLVTLTGRTFDADPHPELPGCFLDRPRVHRLVREISGQRAGDPSLVGEDELTLPACAAAAGGPTDPVPAPPGPGMLDWKPGRGLRTCVATLAECDRFGKQVASEAYRRNFYRAGRRAFVADGQAYNWGIRDRHFADFEPIADFVHVLSYVYAAGLAVAGSATAGWPLYARWVRACWQGRAGEVLAELGRWHQEQPPPASKPPPADPWEVVRKAITYLTNNAGRMNYPAYRRAGLPCMSSWMESLVKEINYRVKGTEKFWNRGPNAEAILQIRAAVLSEDDRLWEHIRNRGGKAFRTYRRKATGAK